MQNALTNPKVTISILTYNRCEILKALLISLKNVKYNPLEIIVIDNHSEDGTQVMMHKEFNQVKYIRTEKNVGAHARNIGMREAKGEIIITLDDDIIGLTDQHIHFLIDRFRAEPRLCAMNFKIYDFKTNNICNWVHHCKVEECADTEFLTYEITEGAVAFRKKVLDEVGYYSETFFLSHEGPDLAFRILNRGYYVIYSPIVVVTHYHSDLGRKPWLRYYYDTRNHLWLAARNLPVSYAIKYLARGLLSMGVYSIRDGFFRYWAKGILDGCKGLRNELSRRKAVSRDTMKIIRAIDANRPDLGYIIRKRLFKESVRL